jgi:signal transduction histidine kinase
MIAQLLDLTRARLAGGVGFIGTRQPLDVASLIQRTADELRGANPNNNLSLHVTGDCTTTGDADRLLQVFSNLISNALQHGAKGSAVAITVHGGEREVAVSVRNRGAIPRELLPTIFDPFRGRRSAGAEARGLGLGLYISEQIALAHGGSIEVASSEDADETVFTVHIPRVGVVIVSPARFPIDEPHPSHLRRGQI